MKKHTIYIILSITTIICLFITAATCSFCGQQLSTASSEEAKADVEEENTEAEETEEAKETSHDTDATSTDDEDQDGQAPTISLSISEGPTYSAADDVCWYRVKATVTGDPTPKISWSTDYSNGSFGNTIAQVNLTRDNPNYTLTATATNSNGSDTDSIDLSWGCDGDVDDDSDDEDGEEVADDDSDEERFYYIPEEVHFLQTQRLDIVGPRSGSVNTGGDTSALIYTGDDEEHNLHQAFLCFDISALAGVTVSAAQIEIGNIRKFGEFLDSERKLYFTSVDYGDLLDSEELLTGPVLFTIPTNGLGESLTRRDDSLAATIQEAVDGGRNWYQIRIELVGYSNVDDDFNDDERDGYRFMLEGLVLQVDYVE